MNTKSITFTVLGTPRPQGSLKAFMVKGKPQLTSDNPKMRPWRQEVGWEALRAWGSGALLAPRDVPVTVKIVFYLRRAKSALKRQIRPTKKPDLDKLARSVLDSLKGVLYYDDSQVCVLDVSKDYGLPERAVITVEAL